MPNHPKLTARQQQILDLIQTALSRTGAPPTRAEIATEMGFKSANAAEEHLQALARKGVIELVSGTSRGIRLCTDAVRSINAARGSAFHLPLKAPVKRAMGKSSWPVWAMRSPSSACAARRMPSNCCLKTQILQ